MKRFFRRTAAAVVALSMLFSLPAFCASADSFDDADITLMDFEINVLSDATVSLVQKITFDFHDDVNGIYVDISDADRIYGLDVEVDGRVFSPVSYAESGDDGVYTEENGKIKIFMPSDGGDIRTVVLRYSFNGADTGAVTKHTDISDFYAKLITGWDFDIKKINVRLTTPFDDNFSPDDFKVWGHTNADGTCSIEENGSFSFTASELLKGESFEIRALFPYDALSIGVNGTGTKQSITDEENSYAAATEAQKAEYLARLEAKRKFYSAFGNILGFLGILFFAGAVSVCVFLYLKYDREYRPEREYDYFRELPEPDATPAEVGALWRFKQVDKTDITATLMDLKYKKVIDIVPAEQYVAENKINRRVKKDDFVIVPIGSPDNLPLHERFVYDWFIGKIGSGKITYLSDLKKYTEKTSSAKQFINDFESFKAQVKSSASSRNYFEKDRTAIKVVCLMLGILIAVALFFGVFFTPVLEYATGFAYFGLLGIPAGVLLAVYPMTIKRRTRYGNQKYTEWKAFRKFLLDFSNMKEASQQSIEIWEHYLVYAVPLGVAETVIKQLKVNIPQDTAAAGGVYYPTLFQYMIWNDIMRSSINRSFENAVSHAAQQVARSQASSSTGGGGGFAGGSFGGGGGGGFGGGGGSF